MLRWIVLIGMAYYSGFKKGMEELENENPCIIDVGGEEKRVPQAVCDAMDQAKSLLGRSPVGPYV